MSDWDRFAAEEYELLVAEEGNAEAMDDMCYEDDPDGNAEMQLEQALDENDIVYHDTMIAANSWWLKKHNQYSETERAFACTLPKLYTSNSYLCQS